MSTTFASNTRRMPEALLSDRYYSGSRLGQSLRHDWRIPPTSMEAEWSIGMRFGDEGGIRIDPKPDDWIMPLLQRVCELGDLPWNWNSYGSRPVGLEAAVNAITLLLISMRLGDPMPAVVPTSRGGVMFEWHEAGVDLEIDVRSSTEVHLAICVDNVEEEFDHAGLSAISSKLDVLRSRI